MIIQSNMLLHSVIEQKRPEIWVSPPAALREDDRVAFGAEIDNLVIASVVRHTRSAERVESGFVIGDMTLSQKYRIPRATGEERWESSVGIDNLVLARKFKTHVLADTVSAAQDVTIDNLVLTRQPTIKAADKEHAEQALSITNLVLARKA